jgi:hypothetical protein
MRSQELCVGFVADELTVGGYFHTCCTAHPGGPKTRKKKISEVAYRLQQCTVNVELFNKEEMANGRDEAIADMSSDFERN